MKNSKYMKRIRKFLIASLATLSMSVVSVSCVDFDDENENDTPSNEQEGSNKDNKNHKDLSGIDSNGREYIDLDLPSGTLWAAYNIGAAQPEDFGYHFAWGETEPKEIYDGTTYKWGEYDMTKYNSEDGLTTLLPEDDAATANWGAEWCMPTIDEIKELINNCEYSWTAVNGVKGARLTGPNGNSLFFPASGLLYDIDVYYVGDFSYCWSSTLSNDREDSAGNANFDEKEKNYYDGFRDNGLPVRAVRVKK